MKQKDIGLIVVVIIISTVFGLVISSAVIGSPKKNAQQVEVVQAITPDFPTPNKTYFNKDAIDPTKVITISNNNNPDPFSKPTQ